MVMIKSKISCLICFFLLSFSSLVSCGASEKFRYQKDKDVQALLKSSPIYPDTHFAVLSDLHFYDKAPGISGRAFQKYLDHDRKLLVLSDELLAEAVKRLSKELDFVFVSGDMTKDGERINQEGVVKALKRLESSGLKFYVAPENHDINNGAAVHMKGMKQSLKNIINGVFFVAAQSSTCPASPWGRETMTCVPSASEVVKRISPWCVLAINMAL